MSSLRQRRDLTRPLSYSAECNTYPSGSGHLIQVPAYWLNWTFTQVRNNVYLLIQLAVSHELKTLLLYLVPLETEFSYCITPWEYVVQSLLTDVFSAILL